METSIIWQKVFLKKFGVTMETQRGKATSLLYNDLSFTVQFIDSP